MRSLAAFFLASAIATTAAGAAPPGTANSTIPSLSGATLSLRGVQGTLPTVQTGVLAPLSSSECKALGGKVFSNPVCNSKESCQRKDENGKTHEVCLSK